MDNRVVYGYLRYAFDSLYLSGFHIPDSQREAIEDALYCAFDQITEEEALDYFRNNPNTNIGR